MNCSADLPGLTQLAGHGGHTANFPCQICSIPGIYGARAVRCALRQPYKFDKEGINVVEFNPADLPIGQNNTL